MAIQQITPTDITGGFSNTTIDVTQTGKGSVAIPAPIYNMLAGNTVNITVTPTEEPAAIV